MKNLIKINIIAGLFILLNASALLAQAPELDFFVQFQNSRIQEAVIYPNPVTDNKFKIKATDIVSKVEIINVIGQSICLVNNNTNTTEDLFVQLSECDKGMYLVKITFDNNKKLIKKLLIK